MLAKVFSLRTWPYIAIIVSMIMLAAAHASEQLLKLFPCQMCLQQRDAYLAAIGIGVAGLILRRFSKSPLFDSALSVLLGLAFLTGTVIAFYHTGVEWGILPSPGCGDAVFDPNALLLEDLTAPQVIGQCDKPTWVIPNAITMSTLNGLVSFGLALSSFWSARTPAAQKDT